jgi:hypothetical protein
VALCAGVALCLPINGAKLNLAACSLPMSARMLTPSCSLPLAVPTAVNSLPECPAGGLPRTVSTEQQTIPQKRGANKFMIMSMPVTCWIPTHCYGPCITGVQVCGEAQGARKPARGKLCCYCVIDLPEARSRL